MNERVKLIRKQLGMTQEQLAQRLGIGKAALSMIETGKAGLSARNRNILVQELNVNPEWLEGGKGNMFNAEPDLTAYMHRTDNSLPLQSVPLYSIEGTAGLVPLFADQAQAKPVNFIHIPNLPKCDGAIYIVGDSMYPLLKSGDIVLYKQLGDINDIFWGDMYLLSIDIDGEEYVTVKYIQKSDREGYVKLVSQNPHHADKDVAINRISNRAGQVQHQDELDPVAGPDRGGQAPKQRRKQARRTRTPACAFIMQCGQCPAAAAASRPQRSDSERGARPSLPGNCPGGSARRTSRQTRCRAPYCKNGTAEAGRAEPGASHERRWIGIPNPKKFVSFGNKTDPTWNYPIKNSRSDF